MKHNKTPNPWERQKNEPNASYALFNEFLKIGPLRTLSKLALKVPEIPQFDTPPSTDVLKKKSAQWKWFERAEAYDLNRIEEERSKIESRATQRLVDRLNISEEIEDKINNKIIAILDHPEFDNNFSKNAYAISELSKSKKVELESQRLDLGEPTIIQKTDMDAKVTSKIDKVVKDINNLFEEAERGDETYDD